MTSHENTMHIYHDKNKCVVFMLCAVCGNTVSYAEQRKLVVSNVISHMLATSPRRLAVTFGQALGGT